MNLLSFEAFYKGFLLGFIIVFSFGPSFFAIVDAGISKGFLAAFCIAIGTIISDTTFVSVSIFGLTKFLSNPTFKYYLGIGGGFMLIVFGLFGLFKKPKIRHVEMNISKLDYLGFLAKGFFMNLLNPFVFIFWFTAVSVVSTEDNYSLHEQLWFFAGTLLCIFSGDTLKAFISHKIYHLLSLQWMKRINVVAACVMIFFGALILIRVLQGKTLG